MDPMLLGSQSNNLQKSQEFEPHILEHMHLYNFSYL